MRRDAIHRLLSIILLLRGGRTETAEALAAGFKVNLRTIYRDIRKLQGAGFPITAAAGPGGGYSLGSSSELDPLLFGDDAALAGLLTGGSLFRFSTQHEAVENVLRRAEELVPAEDRELLQRVRQRIHVDASEWYWRDKPEQDLQIFKEAVLHDKALAITFTERESPTILADVVHPYGLVWKGGFWYLIAYSTREDAFRRCRIQRIIHAESTTGESFQRDREFNLAEFWRKDLDRFGVGSTRVVLRIDAPAVLEFEHFGWKAENKITKADDHWIVEMHVDRFDWLVPLVLSYGGNVRVMEPDTLRKRIIEEAARLARAHSVELPPPPLGGGPRDRSDIRSRVVRGRGPG